MAFSERSGLVAQLPWVTYLDKTRDCDGYRWAHMPLKALRDPEVMAGYRCKNRARWQFRASRAACPMIPAEDGVFCWAHLWALCLRRNPVEEQRTARGLARLRAAASRNTTEVTP
jgi:hypothetical protein